MSLPLLTELNRRRVFRALVVYGIVAFAVLQIIEPIMHGLHWPDAVLSYVVVALALGFPVVVGLAWVFDVSAGRVERTAPAAGGTSTLIHNRALLALVLVGIGVVAAAPGVVYFFFLRNGARRTAVSQGAAVGATPALPAMASIAVLPFVDMSAQKDQEYFSDGVAEEILNALSQVDGLRVIGRTSSFSFKGRNEDLRGIGEKLGVAHLLEGSVRKSGSHIRVTAQLIEASGGSHLWSKVYDRKLTDIFAVQDEIARGVVAALKAKLLPPARAAYRTASLEAHDLYLKGRYFWNKRNPEALRKAEEYFAQAVRADPGYALAYVGLADTLGLRNEYEAVSSADVLPGAKRAALRALEIDPSLAEAHASLGLVYWHEFEWNRALDEFRTAIELRPDYASARKWYGGILSYQGRLQEGRAELERALQADPTSLIINSNLADISVFARDYQAAVAQVKKTLELDPGFDNAHMQLVVIYALQRRYDEALAELDRTRSWPESALIANRAYIYALSGRRSDARQLLRELEERSRREYVWPSFLALISMALGDNDKAFALYQKACVERDSGILILKVDPSLDPLRSDPRFKDLLKCAHLE